MSKLHISLACGSYDRVRGIIDGRIAPEGVEITHLPLAPEECLWRMNRNVEFDVSEYSTANYITELASGGRRFIAIPVFLSRMFRHSFIFVNSSAGIRVPQDLRGKRVGVPEYAITAMIWLRGMLKDDYGVTPEDIHWLVGGMEELGRKEKAKLNLPPTIDLQPAPRTLNDMILSGELDALLLARPPSSFLKGNPAVVRLFPNYAEVEADYYRRTGIFPIMHTVLIRRELYEQNRWLALSLFKAFQAAKEECLTQMRNVASLPVSLPWVTWELERTRAVFGTDDIWPYGVAPNRKTLEKLVEYLYDQHITPCKLAVEDLFAPETIDTFRI